MLAPGRAGLIVAGLVLVTACGVPGDGEADRSAALARTCLSTIARAGLPQPSPEAIADALFAAERQRLLDRGDRFDTARSYRNVCRAIRDELRARQAEAAAASDSAADEDADEIAGDE